MGTRGKNLAVGFYHKRFGRADLALRTIEVVVCRHVYSELNVPCEALYIKKKYEHYVVPRQVFCYLAKRYTKSTYERIAQYLGQDYSTVIHSVRRVLEMYETNDKYADTIMHCEQIIQRYYERNKRRRENSKRQAEYFRQRPVGGLLPFV